MKALLFYEIDLGRGGRGGFLSHHQTWCTEVDGKKYHIHSELIGSPGHPTDGPRRNVSVKPCDGSCMKLVDIPDHIWDKARPQLEVVAQ